MKYAAKTSGAQMSGLAQLLAYLRTRIFTWRIGFLYLLLLATSALISMLSATAGDEPRTWISFGFAYPCAMSASLILQFRLLDDMADRGYDAKHHAERVLVQTQSLRAFIVFLSILALFSLSLMHFLGTFQQTFWYVGLALGLCFVYFFPMKFFQNRIIRTQCVLLKYPVFLYLIVAPPPPLAHIQTLLLAGLCLYFLMSAQEHLAS